MAKERRVWEDDFIPSLHLKNPSLIPRKGVRVSKVSEKRPRSFYVGHGQVGEWLEHKSENKDAKEPKKIRTRMFRLKLLQNIRLLLIIARHPACLLLALIIHHLLNHAPRLTIEVAQLRVLRANLRYVDCWSASHDMRPPFHSVNFV